MDTQAGSIREALEASVLIGALGYFVDSFDMVLFTVVRVASLKSLGVSPEAILDVGVRLINTQMAGMLLGGLFWGVLGDRIGRRSVLFGSILMYSLATAANGFVETVNQYAGLRLLAGFGLAGELGAAITLVSERIPARSRGYGAMLVSAVGLLGSVAAGFVGRHVEWRSAYFIGAALGLILLAFRVTTQESELFRAQRPGDRRGDLRLLLRPARLLVYLRCIVVGIPIYYAAGVLMVFSPELGVALGATGPLVAGTAVIYLYAGATVGDLLSGWISQRLASRRKVIIGFLLFLAALAVAYLASWGLTPEAIYDLYFLLGLGTGYWTIFITVAAEQFGTNLRATVTTTVPNVVRGSTILLTACFRAAAGHLGLVGSAMVVGLVCIASAFVAGRGLEETFGRELDFNE